MSTNVRISLITILLFVLVGCGGGGGGGPTTTVPTNTVDPAIISAIQSNMSTNYTNEQYLVTASTLACFRTWGANSGAAISCSVTAKQTSVQNFLNTIMANILALNLNIPTYSLSIASLINSYQMQDLAWLNVNSLAPNYTMTAGDLSSVTPTYNSSVNTSYSNALIQLNAVSIQSNMLTNYTNEQYLVTASTFACFRTWGVSGNAISCSVTAKQTSVQSFLTTVLANVQALKNISTIDKAAISTLISSYQTQDLAWLNVNSLVPTYRALL